MKNLVWIDSVKCLCMLFVYWLHVGTFSSHPLAFPIEYGPFFVNAFFFVSGYLLFRKFKSDNSSDTRLKTLKNIFFKICIPSMIFSTIDYIPKNIVNGVPMSVGGFAFDVMLRGTNWFTCALAVAELLLVVCFCFSKKVNTWRVLAFSIVFFVVGLLLKTNDVRILGNEYLPWFYKSGLMATLFLAWGGGILRHGKIYRQVPVQK